MAQVKVFGLRASLDTHRYELSEAIHQAIVEALDYPTEKRFQRFIALEEADFIYPSDRSPSYTIIEISMLAGRSTAAKKALIGALYRNVMEACGIGPQDLEITLFETPRENWGIRGQPGDELTLSYTVHV